MKHVLSRTLTLVYGAGISFAVASDMPIFKDTDHEFAARQMPVILRDGEKINPLVNPFPSREDLLRTGGYSHPLMTSERPVALVGIDLVTNPQIRLAQSIVDFEGLQARQLRELRQIKSEYEESKSDLDGHKRELSEELSVKQRAVSEYDQYLRENKVSLRSPQSDEISISEHISFLEGQLSKLTLSSVSRDEVEIQRVNTALRISKTNGSKLESEIRAIQKQLAEIDERSSALQAQSLNDATEIYQALLALKLTTPVELSQFGQIFDGGAIVSTGEVRVALREMGVPKELALKPQTFFSAAVGNMVWPVFSPPNQTRPSSLSRASETAHGETITADSNSTSKITPTGFAPDYQGDIPSTQIHFLQELKARTFEVQNRLHTNYTQHVQGTAALINLMELKKIPINLELRPDELYTHITRQAGIEPDDSPSLFFQSFLTEELFKDYELNVRESLMGNLIPTNKTAVLLLTSGIMKNPTVLEQIGSRILPSDEAMRVIMTVPRNQAPNPAAINIKLLDSLHQITATRFNMLLVDNIMARLSQID